MGSDAVTNAPPPPPPPAEVNANDAVVENDALSALLIDPLNDPVLICAELETTPPLNAVVGILPLNIIFPGMRVFGIVYVILNVVSINSYITVISLNW